MPAMNTDNQTALVRRDFHEISVGNNTVAAFEEKSPGCSTIWVSVRSICSALRIDTTGQVRKLQKKPWARLRSDIVVKAADGKDRAMVVIDVECLPSWLSTIEPGRVSCELGDRLLVLQQRAERAVREHFFPPAAKVDLPEKRLSPREHLVATAEALLDHAKIIAAQRGELAEMKAQIAEIRTAQGAASIRLLALPPAPAVPPIPIRRWIDAVISELSAKIGKDHHDTWRLVYRGLKLHYGVDAYARAKNASRAAGREVAKIDVLESAGLLGEVYAVARELVRQADEGGVAEGPPVG